MGCWNKTCGLSNLPITVDEPVIVFTLVRHNKIDDHCYSTALYSPVTIPFYSHYNDYGAGENSSGIGLSLVIEGLKKSLIEKEQGENPYHDIAVKKDSFDEDAYWDTIHKGRLEVSSYGGEKSVQFVMFHQRVVDHILKNHQCESLMKVNDNYEYVCYKFEDVLADLTPIISDLADLHNDDILSWRPLSILSRPDYDNNLAAEYLRHGDSYRYSKIINVDLLLTDLIKQGAVDTLSEVLIEFVKFRFIDAFMHLTRKQWVPGGHQGSQSSDHDPYKSLMNAMNAVIDEDAPRYAEEYDDDE